jgi:hypothetical protein
MTGNVLFARAPDGSELPIIDVTNPRFAVSPSAEALAELTAEYVRESTARQEVTPELRAALANSCLGRAIMGARGTYLAGLSTYIMKLGPENLPEHFQPIDRRIVASFPALMSRLRLQDMATLISEGVLAGGPVEQQRPLHFINIAGGAGVDSWNALIRLRATAAGIERRQLFVSVLDVDDEGPAFGARALETLTGADAPLDGLRMTVAHHSYHWADPEHLRRILAPLELRQAACAISSEGGLFEYGSDDEIAGNLEILHQLTPDDAIVVGSVTREGDLTRLQSTTGIATKPRTRDAFGRLAQGGGWQVQKLVERPFSDHVRLIKVSAS